jgi:hypothetical protein
VAAFLAIRPETQAASITGEVTFLGAAPSRPPIRVTKDQDYCGETISDESYLIGPGQGLKNVVVYPVPHSPKVGNAKPSEATWWYGTKATDVSAWYGVNIDGPQPGPAPPGERKENLLENRGCRFVPRVIAVRSGERLVVRNSDSKLHIVHAYFEKRTVFNLSLPFRGQTLDVTHKIKRPGLLQLNCDTHGWMRGYIHVFGHPFFAVTDERGFFSIGNIPAGKYSLKAWHEEAGVRSQEVMVAEEGEIKVNFKFGK